MTPAGHSPELASPEPDRGNGMRLQNHNEAGTEYADRGLLLVDNEVMSALQSRKKATFNKSNCGYSDMYLANKFDLFDF